MELIKVRIQKISLIELAWIILSTTFIILIPTISHVLALPIYKLNPMHWIICLYCLSNKRSVNSIVLISILMPIASVLFTGHPELAKGLIMIAELYIYGLVFFAFNKSTHFDLFRAFIISQVSGKSVYYLGKLLFLRFGWLAGPLFSQSLLSQLLVTLLIGIMLIIVFSINRRKRLT